MGMSLLHSAISRQQDTTPLPTALLTRASYPEFDSPPSRSAALTLLDTQVSTVALADNIRGYGLSAEGGRVKGLSAPLKKGTASSSRSLAMFHCFPLCQAIRKCNLDRRIFRPYDADSLIQTLEQSDSAGSRRWCPVATFLRVSHMVVGGLLDAIDSRDRPDLGSRRVVQFRPIEPSTATPDGGFRRRSRPSLQCPGVVFPSRAEPFSSTVGGYRPPGLWIAIATQALPWLQPAKADVGLLAFYSCVDLDGETEGSRDSVESVVPPAVSKKGSLPFGAGGLPRCSGFLFERTRFVNLSPAEQKARTISRRTRNPLAAKSWSPYVLDDVLDFRVFFRRVLSRCNTAACPLPEPEPRPHVMCLACCCSVRRRHTASRASDIHMCISAMAYSMRRPAFGSSKVRAAETRDLCWPICKGIPGTDAEYMRPAKAPLNPAWPDQTGDRPLDPSSSFSPAPRKDANKVKGLEMDRRVERYQIHSGNGCDQSVKRSRLSRRVARVINPLIRGRPLVPLHLKRRRLKRGHHRLASRCLARDEAEGRRSLQLTPHSNYPINRHMDSGAGAWHAEQNAGQILQPRSVSFSRTWSSVCLFQGSWCANCESATPTVSRLSRHGRSATMNRPPTSP